MKKTLLSAKDLESQVQRFTELTILVAGDVMLDEFQWCHVTRLSPEAPVPICTVDHTDHVPGGAANVANNIRTLGATPLLLGIIGSDSSGQKLSSQLRKAKISTDFLLKDPDRPTTLKSRIIAHHQQIARVDREVITPLSPALQAQFFYKLTLLQQTITGVVISDYAKGTITQDMITGLLEFAKARQIPVVIDPKGDDYSKYAGATVLTPNYSEFQTAIRKTLHSEDELYAEAMILIKALRLGGLVITRSEKGATVISHTGEKLDIPTKAKEVFDITGAGDTVIASLTLGLSVGMSLFDATHLSNEAAGVVVGKAGTATITLTELSSVLKSL